MQSKFAYPGSLYKCCYISRATLRYFQGMLYHSFHGAEIIWTSLVNAWMADQGTQNHESMWTPTVHAQPTIVSFGMGYMCTKLLSQAGWKKSVYFHYVDQCWRYAYLPASTWSWFVTYPKDMRNSKLTFPVCFYPCSYFKGVIFHAARRQTLKESTLRRMNMQFWGRLTISSVP